MSLNTGLLRVSRVQSLSLIHNGNTHTLLLIRPDLFSAANARPRHQQQRLSSSSSSSKARPGGGGPPPRGPPQKAAIAGKKASSTTGTGTGTGTGRPSLGPQIRGGSGGGGSPPAVSISSDPRSSSEKSAPPSPPRRIKPDNQVPLPVTTATATATATAKATTTTTLNPPASTRPPPLHLPTRDIITTSGTGDGPPRRKRRSLVGYLYSLGKAYTTFYKEGIKAIFTNRRLLSASSSSSSPTPTRAEVLLRARARHDLARLPVFAALLLVCGELTPFVVVAFPRLTPLTCRIPRQVEAMRRRAAERRAASFRSLPAAVLQPPRWPGEEEGDEDGMGASLERAMMRGRMVAGHVARALGLTSAWWDRVGLFGLGLGLDGGPLARAAADRAVARLARDDAMIRAGGGVAAVEDEEVVLACEDRGMDVRGRDVAELRRRLGDWVRESTGGDGGRRPRRPRRQQQQEGGEAEEEEAMDRVRRMLLRRELLT